MRFSPTEISGVTVVDIDPVQDDRGFFARLHCPEEFSMAGWPFAPLQTSLSHNKRRGTLRGLHYEIPAYAESKLVRVIRGRIFDVAVDLRRDSPTYLAWTGAELSVENGRALLIGPGLAHGFLTLEDDCDVLYQIDRVFQAGHGQGVRWDDPALSIIWPSPVRVISERDANYPDLQPRT